MYGVDKVEHCSPIPTLWSPWHAHTRATDDGHTRPRHSMRGYARPAYSPNMWPLSAMGHSMEGKDWLALVLGWCSVHIRGVQSRSVCICGPPLCGTWTGRQSAYPVVCGEHGKPSQSSTTTLGASRPSSSAPSRVLALQPSTRTFQKMSV